MKGFPFVKNRNTPDWGGSERASRLKRYFLIFFVGIQAIFLSTFTLYNIKSQEYTLASIEGIGLTLAAAFLIFLFLRRRFSFVVGAIYLVLCVLWTYSIFYVKMHDYILIFAVLISLSSYYLLGSIPGAVYSFLYALGVLVMTYITPSEQAFGMKEYLNFFGGYLIINCVVFFYQRNYESASSNLVHLNQELNLLSIKDPLTNLYNRRIFSNAVVEEKRRMQRLEGFMGLAILDLDNFKQYNDLYGHPAGDEVLRRIASILNKCFSRSTDSVFRLGGEEFGVILSDIRRDSMVNSLRTMQQVLKKASLPHAGNTTGNIVTVSICLLIIKPANTLSADEIYRKADRLLYEAKDAGRDTLKHALI